MGGGFRIKDVWVTPSISPEDRAQLTQSIDVFADTAEVVEGQRAETQEQFDQLVPEDVLLELEDVPLEIVLESDGEPNPVTVELQSLIETFHMQEPGRRTDVFEPSANSEGLDLDFSGAFDDEDALEERAVEPLTKDYSEIEPETPPQPITIEQRIEKLEQRLADLMALLFNNPSIKTLDDLRKHVFEENKRKEQELADQTAVAVFSEPEPEFERSQNSALAGNGRSGKAEQLLRRYANRRR